MNDDGRITNKKFIFKGYVTDKELLPVTKLNFGRIAIGSSGKHTLGKLECSGRTTLASMPTSCRDLFIAGNEISGFYMVKTSSRLRTVYCDLNKSPDDTGDYLWNVNLLNY